MLTNEQRLEEGEHINTLFRTPTGQKLLEIWKEVYVNRPSYEPGRPVEECVYYEGQRSQVLSIIQHLELKK